MHQLQTFPSINNQLLTFQNRSLLHACTKKIQTLGLDHGAEDRARTGHLDLGKVALYQMSYFRDYN